VDWTKDDYISSFLAKLQSKVGLVGFSHKVGGNFPRKTGNGGDCSHTP
jgi:hypothetical protein